MCIYSWDDNARTPDAISTAAMWDFHKGKAPWMKSES